MSEAAGDGDWLEDPEAAELRRQMARLEQKISSFKQEMVGDAGQEVEAGPGAGEPGRWSKPQYTGDPKLPPGWTFFRNKEGSMFYRDAAGRFLKNRRNVLAEMFQHSDQYSDSQRQYIRDGLQEEGWHYHAELPKYWMYKQYTHKIEGVDTDVLYHLSPDGTIYRSKKKIQKSWVELGLSKAELQRLVEFRPAEIGSTGRTLEEPDESWYHDPAAVPAGWKMKRYTYNSGSTHKTEEVFHYLTPDSTIVRGKKQVHDWMLRNSCYNSDDFGLFHFNKKEKSFSGSSGRPTVVNWSTWAPAKDLPEGWTVRYGSYKYQKKVQYKSPNEQIFLSRFKVIRFLKSGGADMPPSRKLLQQRRLQRSNGAPRTLWDEWREDDIPCLPGWQFSIGRKKTKRRIRYKSPCGKVFQSRGPLIRYLHENNLKGKQQLITLKKLLKTSQSKQFEDLRTNDKFIKNFTPDWNYLLFLKVRYDNQEDIPEVQDYKLPHGWMKKDINGVEYFKAPGGKYVFNSRKLVVEHLRRTNFDLSDEDLVSIMEDSDSESDLSDSETEESESEEEGDTLNSRSEMFGDITAAVDVKRESIENAEFLLSDIPLDDLMSF